MKFFNLICFILIFINFAHSEIIDGPANVRDLKTNEVLISLFDGVIQDARRIDKNYFELEILGISKTRNDSDYITLSKGDTIYVISPDCHPTDLKNEPPIPIGVVVNNFWANTSERIDSNHVQWYLRCKTHKNNFKMNSVPELHLESILIKKPVSEDLIEKHIEYFGYRKAKLLDALKGFQSFDLSDNIVSDPSPIMRITLSFKQGKLAAIASAAGLYNIDWDVHIISRNFKIYFAPHISVSDRNLYLEKYDNLLNSID
ncbi:hypothetical protein JW964_27135 [candidate division KSB1 bacterium]|nr:hypothetical protein [candidate division KSB1 bacterium]